MATKKKIQDKIETQVDTKVLKLFGDVAFIAIMVSCAFTLMVFALTIAEKITITVGK